MTTTSDRGTIAAERTRARAASSSARSGTRRGLSRRTRVWAVVRGALLVIPMLAGAAAVLAHLVFGFSALTILTGSMRPTYGPGDVIIVRPVAVAQLRVGQIPVVRPPGETTPIAHRIVAISHVDGRLVLQTKGDANPARDRWQITPTSGTVPVVVAIVPRVGSWTASVQSPRARALLIVLIGTAFTGGLIRHMARERCGPDCEHRVRRTAAPITKTPEHPITQEPAETSAAPIDKEVR